MIKLAHSLLPNAIFSKLTETYFRATALMQNGLGGYHSKQSTVHLGQMTIHILPALSDNYMYLIIDETSRQAAIVDPVEPETVLKLVNELQVKLTKILTTHHHWDHAGGNKQLVKKWKKYFLEVIGGDRRISGLTTLVRHGDKFTIGRILVKCLLTPCHTNGHICYFLTVANKHPVVFTGDTLFVAGCGTFFEGTSTEMYESLQKLGTLPENTLVFCGHEYTMKNLRFAQYLEGENEDIRKRIEFSRAKRQKGEPTVPSTIGDEKNINPFMRVCNPFLQEHYECIDPISTMDAIRKDKVLTYAKKCAE